MSRGKRIAATVWATLVLLACAVCAGCSTIQTIPPVSCSELIPETWKKGIPHSDLPVKNEKGEWVIFALETDGGLAKANDRTKDSIEIIEKCEAQVRKAYIKTTKRWWEVWK